MLSINLDHILPLTDFKRKSSEVRKELKASGMPAVLTIDGHPELIVQDAEAYERLLDRLDKAEAMEAIRQGMDDIAAGRSMTLEEFDRRMRQKFNFPPRQ